jgi:hypothetical protein
MHHFANIGIEACCEAHSVKDSSAESTGFFFTDDGKTAPALR